MKGLILVLPILLLPLSLCAMTPLTETDLSNVSNPLSLSINPDRIMEINNKTNLGDDSERFNKLLQTSLSSMIHFDMNLFEDLDETAERYATNKEFYSFPWLEGNNDILYKIPVVLPDPVTWNVWTFEDTILKDSQILSITWKSYIATINGQVGQAEDINNAAFSWTQTTDTPTIPYSHPKDDTRSSNTPLTYTIMSGNIEMRNTYINDSSSTIQSGSWLNIRTR